MFKLRGLFCFCLGILFTISYAQDGSPDLSFGDDGVVIHEVAGEDHYIAGVGEKSNGKILSLIKTFDTNGLDRIFAFNEDGSMDTSFGTNGILDITAPNIDYNGIRVLSDDSYFLISKNNTQFTISKYDQNGNLDISFGDNGLLQPFLNGGTGDSMIVNEDQTLYFLGIQIIAGVPNLLFLKYLENGLPDTSFGNNGMVLYSLDSVTSVPAGFKKVDEFFYLEIRLQENNIPTKNIYRFFLNGDIDTSFGATGRVIIPIEEEYSISYNVFQDGTILIGGGYWDNNTDTYIRKTIKINPQGEVIQSFGNNGTINDQTGEYIQGNQRFISNRSFPDWEGGVIPNYSRFFPYGFLDTSFSFSSNYSELGWYIMSHLQSGKILIVGSDIWYNGPDINIVLQRFNNNPLHVSDIEISNIAVYPNPSNGIFQIQSQTTFNYASFEIFDSLGKKVLSGHFNENFPSIDLSNAESGVYFLKIADNSQSIKLIKK